MSPAACAPRRPYDDPVPTDRLDALLAQLTDPDAGRRRAAAEGLGELPAGEALEALDALTIAVDDPDAEVRLAAVHALGAIDPAEAEAALFWASQSEDYRVQRAANTLLEGTARRRGPETTFFRDPSIGRSE